MNIDKKISIIAILISLATIVYHVSIVKGNVDHLSKENNEIKNKINSLEHEIKKITIKQTKTIEKQRNINSDIGYLRENIYKIDDSIKESSTEIRDLIIKIYKEK